MFSEKDKLIDSLKFLHTTELGAERAGHNLGLDTGDIVGWCAASIVLPESVVTRRGNNWNVRVAGCEITVNADSLTIITAHKYRQAILVFRLYAGRQGIPMPSVRGIRSVYCAVAVIGSSCLKNLGPRLVVCENNANAVR